MKRRAATAVVAFAVFIAIAGVVLIGAKGPGTVDTAYGDSVDVVVVVREQHPPPDGLTAVAESYNIAVNWRNPVISYWGTLIEWYTDAARLGTPVDQDWYRCETYYPPANWASVSAPMGARYLVRGRAYYEGGASMSVPAQASVVVTAPVTVTSVLAEEGYAASPQLRARYGNAQYTQTFETQLQVPGANANYTLGQPVSWSAKLDRPARVMLYRLQPRDVYNRDRTKSPVHGWALIHVANATFIDGYPSLARFSFVKATPGIYKVVITGQYAPGFTTRGSDQWTDTRYITLKPTKFSTALSVTKPPATVKRSRKRAYPGKLTPARATRVTYTVQRKVGKTWKAYRTISTKSNSAGAFKASMNIKRRGLYRVRAAAPAAITGPYNEYTSGVSAWRSFRVR